jgi:prepilin-type processing-associated H-X9-DG protein
MNQFAQNPVSESISPRTSRLAIASFVMGLVSLVICVLWPVLALPAIICGIIALVKISGSNKQLKGTGYAITGIVLPVVMAVLLPFLAMFLAIMMPALNKTKHIAQQAICGINLKGLGTAMRVYASDYDNQLPPADRWCDLLITKADVSPKSLVCPDSDTVEGESSYAMNINAVGKKLDELPADMVLLFETDTGKEDWLRNMPINSRIFYSFMEENDHQWIVCNKNQMIYPDRWNQAGGPEIMRTEHKGGPQPGCNVVFADGHVAFISGDELQKLRWTAEEKKP